MANVGGSATPVLGDEGFDLAEVSGWPCGSAAQGLRRRYAINGDTGSGGVLPEGDDVVAEGLDELSAGLAAAVGVPGVPVRSEIAVAGGGIVEQVPDDDQDGTADGAAGLLPPAAAGTGGQPAEPLAEEGIVFIPTPAWYGEHEII